jgi:hypothetical protein
MLAATIAAQYPASMVGVFLMRIELLRSEPSVQTKGRPLFAGGLKLVSF